MISSDTDMLDYMYFDMESAQFTMMLERYQLSGESSILLKGLSRAYGNRPVIQSVCPSVHPHHVWCISPILFKIENPNLVCGCFLGWPRVAYHFGVTVTLTSPRFLNNRVKSISPKLLEVEIPNLVYGCILG